MYFVHENGDYIFDVSQLEQAHRWCQQRTEQWLSLGEDVVVANTFVRRWEMKAYQRIAQRFGAELKVITCKGEYQNIHGVSPEVIARMRRRWQE
jgi:predicted kinase